MCMTEGRGPIDAQRQQNWQILSRYWPDMARFWLKIGLNWQKITAYRQVHHSHCHQSNPMARSSSSISMEKVEGKGPNRIKSCA